VGHVFTIWLRFKGEREWRRAAALSGDCAFGGPDHIGGLRAHGNFESIHFTGLDFGNAAFPLWAGLLHHPPQTLVWAVLGSALIVAKHHQNIRRLIAGRENRFEFDVARAELYCLGGADAAKQRNLLEILVCPLCKEAVRLTSDGQGAEMRKMRDASIPSGVTSPSCGSKKPGRGKLSSPRKGYVPRWYGPGKPILTKSGTSESCERAWAPLREQLENTPSLLLIRLRSLGDSILTLPLLEALHSLAAGVASGCTRERQFAPFCAAPAVREVLVVEGATPAAGRSRVSPSNSREESIPLFSTCTGERPPCFIPSPAWLRCASATSITA